jgi:hypothetical protein
MVTVSAALDLKENSVGRGKGGHNIDHESYPFAYYLYGTPHVVTNTSNSDA